MYVICIYPRVHVCYVYDIHTLTKPTHVHTGASSNGGTHVPSRIITTPVPGKAGTGRTDKTQIQDDGDTKDANPGDEHINLDSLLGELDKTFKVDLCMYVCMYVSVCVCMYFKKMLQFGLNFG